MQNLLFRCSFLFLVIIHVSGCTKDTDDEDILHIDRTFVFPSGFPPDPGDAGKKTLQGIDSDDDGVRDDVQRWIYARYPKDEQKRKALFQMAQSYQEDLRPTRINNVLRERYLVMSRAVGCLSETFSDFSETEMEMKCLKAKVLNTAQRSLQFLKNDSSYSGKALGEPYPSDGTACEN